LFYLVKTNSLVKTNFSTDALITGEFILVSIQIDFCLCVVNTAQALFEPRNSISLMCRMSNTRKGQCKTQWFGRNDELLNSRLGEKTDLIIKNATFDDHMGLYTCQICCSNQCQKLTSFVYPVSFYL
jgi:hypothetical protein